jgi:hypothetical protein
MIGGGEWCGGDSTVKYDHLTGTGCVEGRQGELYCFVATTLRDILPYHILQHWKKVSAVYSNRSSLLKIVIISCSYQSENITKPMPNVPCRFVRRNVADLCYYHQPTEDCQSHDYSFVVINLISSFICDMQLDVFNILL